MIAVLLVCWLAVAIASHRLIMARPARTELDELTGGPVPSAWQRTINSAGGAVASVRRRAGVLSPRHEADLAVLGDSVVGFYGEKVVAAVALLAWVPAVSLLGGPRLPLAWSLLGGLLGWFTPNAVMRSKVAQARQELRNGVAEVALALSLAVAGGAGIDAAFRGALESSSGRFAAELKTARHSRPRASARQVIESVAERLDLIEASNLASTLGGSDHGAAVGEALDELAWSMVEDRRIEAGEARSQATVKVEVIISALMVPGYFVLIGFPALRLALAALAGR